MIDQLDKLLTQKQFPQAIALGEQLTQQSPQNVHAWLSLSEAYRSTGNCDQSIRCSKQAFELDSLSSFALAQYARCLLPAADYAAITALLQHGITQPELMNDNQTKWALDTLASCAIGIDNWNAALTYYQALLSLEPGNPHYHYMLGVVYSVKGARDNAITMLQQAIKLNPLSGAAYHALLDVEPTLVDQATVEKICINPALSASQKMWLHNVLGQSLQRLGRYAESFRHYQQANDIKRGMLRYSVDDDVDLFEAIASRSGPSEARKSSGAGTNIFIVGLPRSGSTLVENLLVNSGQVEAAGELRDFEVLLLQALDKQATQQLTAQDCSKLPHLDYTIIGQQYQQRTITRIPAGKRVSDKNPFNFRFIGMILQAMPDAHIIHVRKLRMDACFGNFKHLFASAAPYSCTLKELQQYYAAYDKLMQFWDRQFPERILTVNYEDLLTDPRSISQQLYEFCGLSWQESILNTATPTREIKTASANQVRQGMHTQAIGAWKPYAEFLNELWTGQL